MKRIVIAVALLAVLFGALDARALIIPSDEGKWPETWPKQLEPLRKTSKTLDVATGIQEHIYTIPFETRDEFEKFWPILITLRTPGSPLTLSKSGTESGWGQFVSNSKPCVRIKGPTGGYAGGKATIGGQIDLKELDAGTMLFAGAPWPKSILGPQGELPEYVTAVPIEDGKIAWKPIDPAVDKRVGFLSRARVDIELVLDGEIIDLNRIRLPADARIIDRRFPDVAAPKP
jgi:hypothetical protein